MTTKSEAGVRLERMLLPDTPDAVRSLYLSFEEQARTREFGLLEEDLVVLDTETTGLSFRTSELIEIAAARISGRQIVDRYQTFVKPKRPIPPEISQLTGIEAIDVADAPDAVEAVEGLAEFVGGLPVIAHNAVFDRTFIESVPGGGEVTDTWIDSLALSRIALPRLSTHRLADLAAAFGCTSVAHRAMADVEALSGVWRVILCGLASLPAGVLAALADMHEDVEWPFRPIISHLALEQGGAHLDLQHVRRELLRDVDAPVREDPAERFAQMPLSAPTRAELDEEFAPGGVVPRMYEAYERRPEQVAMSERVLRAFSTSSHLSVEAGTGVGKSVAYLLPAARFARANNITVGVATKTNALTDQLVSHELPALDHALPEGLRYFSLKGYDHYPCLRRLLRSLDAELPEEGVEDQRRSRSATESEMLTALAVTLAYVSQSPSGDLDSLGIRWRSVPRSMLTTTPDQCQHGRCPFFPKLCMLHGARRRAASADVVVTNHSLLLRNVEAEGNILPPIRHWVVDEAHSFEQEARRQWAVEMGAEASRAAFEALGGIRTGAIHTMLGQTAGLEASTLVMGLLTKAAATVSRASVACGDLFDEVRGLKRLAGRNSGYNDVTLWIGEEVRQTPEWARVAEAGVVAADRLEEACKHLDEANLAIAEAVQAPASDLLDATRTLHSLFEATKLIIDGSDESYVYSASLLLGRSGVGTEKLVAEKLDVGAELAHEWLPDMMSVAFTSATIAVGDDFSHFEHAVGLDRLESGSHQSVRLDSSFDFDSNMAVVVTKDLPQPNDPRYLDALEDLLYDIHVEMGGSVLTLFTNRRDMERVHEGVSQRLAEHGLEVMIQGRGMGPRQLRDRFLAEESISLFALKSFWEGFDAGGDTLRCVVVPKLPFASPNDPLVRERDLREPRAWWRYSLPEAVLSVKQAAGRLIRTATDQGVLVMCDSRLVSKRYGRAFISSLPSSNCQVLGADSVGRFIRMWRKSRER